jgi:hypothetical protein
VTYNVRFVPANQTSQYDFDTWEVVKQPAHGDLYVVATYNNESLANWCHGSLAGSLEARGAK